jgi:hypothetical protein
MPAPTVTTLPDPPLRSEDSATFSAKAEAFVAALVDFVPEVNDLATYLQSLESGTLSALLAAISTAGSSANQMAYYTGPNAVALADLTAAGRALLDDADAAAQRATLSVYSQSQVDALVTGLLDLKGTQDCSANPNYPSASKGDAYIVSVAGKIGGASGASVDAFDVYVALADNAGGTQASVGSSWFIIEHNLVGALRAANNLSDVADPVTAGANIKPIESFIIACSDDSTAITTGTAKATFRMPYAFTVTDVRASVNTAPTGSTILIDINEAGTTILSTKLMIDAGEKTSTTAATPYVISDASLADDAEITIDFDQVGSTIAGKGVKVILIGHRT